MGVFMPIFSGGRLVAWSASKGHVADIGGMTAGGYDPRAREVWQEAFRIPPLKLHDRGELRRDVWDLVRANIRFEIVAEDIKAMIGACTIGRRELADLGMLEFANRKLICAVPPDAPPGSFAG